MKVIIALLLFLSCVPCAVSAATPAYDRKPPGEIQQTANFNFGGSFGKALYVAVVSRQSLGEGSSSHKEYQPYLTIYRQNPQNGELAQIYQSPGSADSLHLVAKRMAIPKTALWMPGVELNIVGAGQLMELNAQQLAISVYEHGADCGQVTIHVLRLDPTTQKLQDALQVQNFCKLDADIANHSLQLSGPYYAKSAPLCCPTKNNAQATVQYSAVSKRWSIDPHYFTLMPGVATVAEASGANASEEQTATSLTCQPIQTQAGQTFSLSLPSNRTTGYSWQVDLAATASSIKMISSTYQLVNSGLAGTSGKQLWNFVATAKGTMLLALRYARPFDTSSIAPAKEALYVIVAR